MHAVVFQKQILPSSALREKKKKTLCVKYNQVHFNEIYVHVVISVLRHVYSIQNNPLHLHIAYYPFSTIQHTMEELYNPNSMVKYTILSLMSKIYSVYNNSQYTQSTYTMLSTIQSTLRKITMLVVQSSVVQRTYTYTIYTQNVLRCFQYYLMHYRISVFFLLQ